MFAPADINVQGTFPPALGSVPNLESLTAFANAGLRYLDPSFCRLAKLKLLNLAGNPCEPALPLLCRGLSFRVFAPCMLWPPLRVFQLPRLIRRAGLLFASAAFSAAVAAELHRQPDEP